MQVAPPSLFSTGLQGLNRSNQMLARSSERLSTGLAINRGSDNPAGLIASEALRERLTSIESTIQVTSRNNMTLSIEEGALSSDSGSVADLRGLVIQGANAGGLTGDESGAISGNINSAIQGMEFTLGQSGSDVLSGVSVDRQIGTDGSGDPIYETLTMSDLAGLAESDPVSAQALIDEAGSAIATRRAEIGAEQRSNESMQRAMEEEQINVARAESSIRDTDYAKEASESVRASILGKASISVLLIGQEQSKRVLDLLI